MKDCSPWERPMLEKFMKDCILWVRLHVRAGQEFEQEGTSETKCHELSTIPIRPYPCTALEEKVDELGA